MRPTRLESAEDCGSMARTEDRQSPAPGGTRGREPDSPDLEPGSGVAGELGQIGNEQEHADPEGEAERDGQGD